jgi:DMSO/TMAO reductase YedYZ molybdopterin-dependent catalytic subunit
VATAATSGITLDELRLAGRNHAMPLEALRHDITPLGLHYLLIHFDIPHVDVGAWRLRVGGEVSRPLELTLADLQGRPARTLAVTMECAGNGRALMTAPRAPSQPWLQEAVGTAEWTGTPLAGVLADAGLRPGAREVVFTGLDRGVQGDVEHAYERSLPLDDATGDEVLLAWAVNGRPLPPQHGFPLRLVVPGWYGMTHVKWLGAITVVDEPFRGWQQEIAYRLGSEDEPGEPVTRMLPRSLMVPPGIPDFLTRARFVEAGPCPLQGRAWSGCGEVERVEVSTDGGETWADAALGEPVSEHAWRGWSFVWDAEQGAHELCCRAIDAAGNTQPLAPPWNEGGYCNNAVQRIAVRVPGTPGDS